MKGHRLKARKGSDQNGAGKWSFAHFAVAVFGMAQDRRRVRNATKRFRDCPGRISTIQS